MPKIKIALPEKFFDVPISIPVRITDINYGNHVGNDSLVSIIHEARMKLLQHFRYTELNIEGAGLIMSALVVEFKSESFYNDVIDVKIGCLDVSRVSFELFYRLSTTRNEKEIIIANAQTTMVCFDYKVKKVVLIPYKLNEVLLS